MKFFVLFCFLLFWRRNWYVNEVINLVGRERGKKMEIEWKSFGKLLRHCIIEIDSNINSGPLTLSVEYFDST